MSSRWIHPFSPNVFHYLCYFQCLEKVNLLNVSNFTNFTYAKPILIDSLQKNCGEIPMLTDEVTDTQRYKLEKFLYLEKTEQRIRALLVVEQFSENYYCLHAF